MKKRIMTAEELLADLRKDPSWVARQQRDEEARQRLSKEFSSLEKPVLSELHELGIKVPTLGDLSHFERYMPLSPQIVGVLLRWLVVVPWRLKDPIVRLLGAPSLPYDGCVLSRVFEDSLSIDLDKEKLPEAIYISEVRWALANTIAEACPFGITDWVIEKVKDPWLGKSKEMLLLAVARLAPPNTAIPLLCQMFDEFPANCAMGLGEIGGESEAAFLEDRKKSYSKETKKELTSAIKKIKERIGLRNTGEEKWP